MIHKNRENGHVDFLLEHPGSGVPYVVGSWDDWSQPGIPMVRQAEESRNWKATVQLSPGRHQFRYRIGGRWFNDPSADFYVDNGLGGENGVVILEEPAKKNADRSPSRTGKTKNRRS